MKNITRISVIALAAAWFANSVFAHTGADLRQELVEVEERILDAEEVASTHRELSVRGLAAERLEILKLTRAVLENRVLAIEGGVALEVEVPIIGPDLSEVAALAVDMARQEEIIAEAEAAVATASGIDLAIASTRLESERLALSQMRVAYIRARYGSPVSSADLSSVNRNLDAAIDTSTNSDSASRTANSGSQASTTNSEVWADPRYPNIDYSRPAFERAYAGGASISGWWAISRSRGGDTLEAQNLSAYSPDSELGDHGLLLEIGCGDHGLKVTVLVPDQPLVGFYRSDGRATVDVSYRTGNRALRRAEWAVGTQGAGAYIEGQEATEFIDELYGSRRLLIEVIDLTNNRVRGELMLDGYETAVELIKSACSVAEEINLSRADYRLIQTMLTIAGFSPGAADGIWGARSSGALRAYQRSAGLAETGKPDRDTLKLLGLMR